jgi:hypothetical protein
MRVARPVSSRGPHRTELKRPDEKKGSKNKVEPGPDQALGLARFFSFLIYFLFFIFTFALLLSILKLGETLT